jgi:hypothetical protein
MSEQQASKVTRFEVIDATGRAFTAWGVKVDLSYQDDGRTLKVFLTRRNDEAQDAKR